MKKTRNMHCDKESHGTKSTEACNTKLHERTSSEEVNSKVIYSSEVAEDWEMAIKRKFLSFTAEDLEYKYSNMFVVETILKYQTDVLQTFDVRKIISLIRADMSVTDNFHMCLLQIIEHHFKRLIVHIDNYIAYDALKSNAKAGEHTDATEDLGSQSATGKRCHEGNPSV